MTTTKEDGMNRMTLEQAQEHLDRCLKWKTCATCTAAFDIVMNEEDSR